MNSPQRRVIRDARRRDVEPRRAFPPEDLSLSRRHTRHDRDGGGWKQYHPRSSGTAKPGSAFDPKSHTRGR